MAQRALSEEKGGRRENEGVKERDEENRGGEKRRREREKGGETGGEKRVGEKKDAYPGSFTWYKSKL